MKRVDLLIQEDYLDYLKSRSGTLSQHIRFAIANYVHKLQQEEIKLAQSASASESKRKEG